MDDAFKPQDGKKSGGECWREGEAHNGSMHYSCFSIRLPMLLWSRRLTEDSSHRQDEQLQQRVLFLIGQTQEAQLGHFGEVRDSSPYYLMGWRQLWDSGTNRRTVEKSATLSNLRFIFRKTSKLQIKKLLAQVLEQDRYKSFFFFFQILKRQLPCPAQPHKATHYDVASATRKHPQWKTSAEIFACLLQILQPFTKQIHKPPSSTSSDVN